MTSPKKTALSVTTTPIAPRISVGVASSITDRASAFKVRHGAYCGRLMACSLNPTDPHDMWDGDERTTLYVVRDGDRIVGSARSTRADSKFGLPADKLLELPRRADEMGRVALDPHYHPPGEATRQIVHLSLLGAAVQHRWAEGRFLWVQTMRRGMALILSEVGVPFEPEVSVIKIADRTASGVPLHENLYLGYLDLRHVAAALYTFNPMAYRLLFGTDKPLVEYDAGLVNDLAIQIELNKFLLRS